MLTQRELEQLLLDELLNEPKHEPLVRAAMQHDAGCAYLAGALTSVAYEVSGEYIGFDRSIALVRREIGKRRERAEAELVARLRTVTSREDLRALLDPLLRAHRAHAESVAGCLFCDGVVT